MKPDFLTLGDVLAIHADQIERYGGAGGVRDMGLLQSALAMPRAAVAGRHLHADLFQMAAAYLFHLVRNHPFTDGNKRVGAVAAIVFLSLNGVELEADEAEVANVVLSVARGAIGKDAIAEFFSRHAHPRS